MFSVKKDKCYIVAAMGSTGSVMLPKATTWTLSAHPCIKKFNQNVTDHFDNKALRVTHFTVMSIIPTNN